jgi:hypothetical protein
MNKEEIDNMLKSLFPVGEERYIKVKYHDFEKCIKHFRLSPPNKEDLEKFISENGYEITSIGIQSEWTPQISALAELRDEISYLNYEYDLDLYKEKINSLINEKIEDLLYKTSMYPIK